MLVMPPPAAPALSEMSRVVLRDAAATATRHRAAAVQPEHVLLALLPIHPAGGNGLLRGQGVRPEAVAQDLAAQLGPGVASTMPPPLAPGTGTVLAIACAEAAGSGAEYVGTEFLLLALATQADRPAGRVLTDHGLDVSTLRAAITSSHPRPPA